MRWTSLITVRIIDKTITKTAGTRNYLCRSSPLKLGGQKKWTTVWKLKTEKIRNKLGSEI